MCFLSVPEGKAEIIRLRTEAVGGIHFRCDGPDTAGQCLVIRCFGGNAQGVALRDPNIGFRIKKDINGKVVHLLLRQLRCPHCSSMA